ncbi:8600_t:CDS:2 [Scutellospora calospora]|uniref:8600_t:CDS:1 n=1 Tax=Scutellospora calospora TaxID=85575 RepID=A0ACA9JU55_9GLOM|nr:8600_t:CDS:2 [Scutellospora calospora]
MLQPSTLKRRLVTLLEEFKRARQSWTDLNDEGLTLANTLVNTKIQERHTDNPSDWTPELNDFTSLNNDRNILDEKIVPLKESLQKIINKMTKQLTKMKMQILQLEFLLEEACESMDNEMDLKQKIILSLELELEKQQFIVILSTWLNQPYIDFDKIIEFENICEIEIQNKKENYISNTG